MPITDAAARNAKPNPERDYKLFDEHRLYLLVTKKGGKYWRFKYEFGGKERLLALGVYPDVSLKRARELHEEARRALRDGVDPRVEKVEAKLARVVTFELVHNEWAQMRKKNKMADGTKKKIEWLYNGHLAKPFGSHPIGSISTEMIVKALVDTANAGLLETAHRMRMRLNQIFRYAKKTKRVAANPCVDLERDVLPPVSQNQEHHAAIIEPSKLGDMLRAIDTYVGQPQTVAALKLSALLFVRPGELRKAQWSEVDFARAEWRIRHLRMKSKEYHVVPLPRQAIAILRDLQQYVGNSAYVFPQYNDDTRPMSENTVRAALIRLGYLGEQTPHGFRTTASTLLNEQEYDADKIEKQLAHAPRNKVRAAYNRAQKLPGRRAMMQDWADYLDELRAQTPGGDIAAHEHPQRMEAFSPTSGENKLAGERTTAAPPPPHSDTPSARGHTSKTARA